MANQKHEGMHPTISEAVETLSSIAEMDFDRKISMANEEVETVIATHEEEVSDLPTRTIQLFYTQTPEDRVEIIKEIFSVILHYLKTFYKKEFRYMANQQSSEGIKAIMVIVGEAAKKMDQHQKFFAHAKIHSITDLPEYKKLQEFYLSRIARKIDEGVLSKWIMGLSQRLLAKGEERAAEKLAPTRHVFVDLDSVKKDTEYELFFIRKQDGTRFYSPRLIRNIKLVCDFGDRLGEMKKDDPLESLRAWKDLICQVSSKNILDSQSALIHRFYHEATNLKESELCKYLSKALIALLLCSNGHHVNRSPELKSSLDYFLDFEEFLRLALHSREYQKYIAYPPAKSNKAENCLLDVTHALCQGLFMHLNGYEAAVPNVLKLIEEARQEYKNDRNHNSEQLWEKLHTDYIALGKLVKAHANGPLIKVLEILEEGRYQAYDPFMQENIPCQFFQMETNEKPIVNIRMACPSCQESIQNCKLNEEFKGFLRSLKKDHANQQILIFNFQDRTSWREHERTALLEDLQKHGDFSKQLTVVTLPKDTEFYHQEAPYHQDSRADVFMKHFKEQLKSEKSGFYFPESIKKTLFSQIDGIMNGVHQVFFKGRNVLPLERRQDFIEIFYLLLELKIIELVKPDAFAMICKDGVDVGPAASASMYIFLKWMQVEHLNKKEFEKLILMTFVPQVVIRERLMNSERFHRMQNMIKEIELVRNEKGWKDFAKLIEATFGGQLSNLQVQ